MDLHLQPDEAAILARILTISLSNLREEVYRTENYELRQALKQDEAVIKTLIARLDDLGVTVS